MALSIIFQVALTAVKCIYCHFMRITLVVRGVDFNLRVLKWGSIGERCLRSIAAVTLLEVAGNAVLLVYRVLLEHTSSVVE